MEVNEAIAARLEEVAALLAEQGANPHRVRAYRRAAATVRGLGEQVSALLERGGPEALEELPAIGPSIARSIQLLVRHGRLPQLDRLRGDSDPVALFSTIPGVGPVLAEHLHDELHVDTLEGLEAAAHDGRLGAVRGVGPKRLTGIRDHLAQRLRRVRRRPRRTAPDPPVEELLDVDREYRERAAAGELPRIAPRRFNPDGEPWLPVLHARRGDRHYTALFSNTRRAHELGRTTDWVVVYCDADDGERQWTVITSTRGPLFGRRIVVGREEECRRARDDGPADRGPTC